MGEERAKTTVVVIFALATHTMGGLIAIPTGASGDEAFRISGEVREVMEETLANQLREYMIVP